VDGLKKKVLTVLYCMMLGDCMYLYQVHWV